MRKNIRYRWAAAAGAAVLVAGGVAAAVTLRGHAASKPPVVAISKPPVVATSKPPVVGTSKPPVVGTSKPPVVGTSKPPVVEILLENEDDSSVVGDTTDAPYINHTLIPSGTLYTNYYAVSHPSLPNYLALVTGDTCGKDGTDNVTPLCSETTVFNQLSSAGIPAGEYEENESADCSYVADSVNDSDGNSMYAERHDPYGSDSAAEGIFPCGNHTLGTGTASPGVGSLVTALKSSSPPQFAFITPNLCDDAHDCPLSSADSWLSSNVPSLLNAGADVIVTFDESESDDTNGGGKVMTVQVGPGVTAGAQNSTLYTHYSLLAGVEKYFGLPLLSNAASATPLPVGRSSSTASPSPRSSSP